MLTVFVDHPEVGRLTVPQGGSGLEIFALPAIRRLRAEPEV
jgi:hypothetical protein